MAALRTIDQLVREFRRNIMAVDIATARRLLAEYRRAVARLSPELRAVQDVIRLSETIEDAERWVRDTDAAARLLAAAEHGMAEFGRFAADEIEKRRAAMIEMSAQHDDALTYATVVGNETVTPGTAQAIRSALTAIPVEAVTNVVGALEPGTGLRALFDEFGPDASRRLGETLVSGITQGHGAEQIARSLRVDLDGDATRALRIGRTEPMRAYRSASLERYRMMRKVYSGWKWSANLDERTCPVCIAKHGSEHDLDEEFGSHPCCRCRPLPVTRPLSEILSNGSPDVLDLQRRVEDARPAVVTGPEWFARQSAGAQRRIVGPLKLAAIEDGRIELVDVVVEHVDPVWGLGHRTASLRQALENANARRAA